MQDTRFEAIQVVAGGHERTFYRGPGHTPRDVAEWGRRLCWPQRELQDVEVRNEAGQNLRRDWDTDPLALRRPSNGLLYVTLRPGHGG